MAFTGNFPPQAPPLTRAEHRPPIGPHEAAPTKETVMARKAVQVLAVVLLGALLAVPLAWAANPAQTTGPTRQELRALELRSEALNRIYHLGRYAGGTGPTAQELRALELRSEALNRIYRLGPYAGGTGSSFHWGDAGIGSAVTLGAILLGLAAVVAVSRRRAGHAA
jgi:hypothetical protein